MKKKNVMALAVAAALGLGVLPPAANAVSSRDIQQKRSEIDALRSKRSEVQEKISESQKNIESLQSQQKQVANDIAKLNVAIEETSGKIRNVSADIDQTERAITQLKQEIAEIQERIEKRNEILKERLRSLQESGGAISYLEVLLGAQSFSDFIDRMSAVTTIMEADQQIIREQEADKALKEKKETELTEKRNKLQADLQELKQLQASLAGQLEQKNQLMADLKQKEEEEHEHQLALEEEKELIAKQEAAVKQQLAELERQKRAEEEAAKQRGRTYSPPASKNGGEAPSGGSVPPVSSGAFTRPANGPITSGFGYRFGGTDFHPGVDIGKRAPVVPVVAAADGVVFRSYYSSSYGNVIFVSHVIDGQLYTTVYAHLEARLVGEGQRVQKGQIIGYMGNTGDSTGPHLHFELHRGEWNPGKTNAVDPRNYIAF
ncbi:murein hydrolase activator EnvC [Geobacillus sp. C56-T2]|uniref:murein hydrolase activator EnvC family protein n=1 Tax=Geobacillus sp. C56-T2 TaxID=600773 RepID=UPI00119D72E4|nr:peptidoglycan DD-metalloendopeptidase family protein [Geobacillus sp. C56-T2]NNV06881.1 peptidase M23 [Geobacillus sp. MMMUD3]TWG31849.1 peptidoglycan hydrolase CwlO-like protein [Geobacillus sp. C56-T2]